MWKVEGFCCQAPAILTSKRRAPARFGKVEGFCCQAPAILTSKRRAPARFGKVEGFCCQAPSGPRLPLLRRQDF